jgi:geranylgeranyl pyrophosphate synthase
MRYSVLGEGKRVRPFLVLEAAAVCGAPARLALPLACAVEMIHAYSLVHDDLPAMDDDDVRRGKATCHRRFDEATAILAGDALLSQAFEVIAEARGVGADRIRSATRVLSRAIGPRGMVGGQALDLEHREGRPDLGTLRRTNRLKTGALIRACLEAGAIWAGASARDVATLRRYGESIGSLFQVVDDIIDGDGYVRLMGPREAYRRAAELRDRAKRLAARFGARGRALADFADFLYQRKK